MIQNDFGSAEWLTKPEEIQAARLFENADHVFGSGGVIIGSGSQGLARYHDEGHTMMFAPPGSGKGIGFVIPNCVAYSGSLLVIDPKGENAAITARSRAKHNHNVHILDPFGVSGKPTTASYNPIAWLYHSEPRHFMADLAAIAEALIVPEEGQNSEHWYQQGVNMIEGILLDIYEYTETTEDGSLIDIYERAFRSTKTFEAMWQRMTESDHPDPRLRSRIQAAGNWYFSIHEEEMAAIRSTVQKNLRFLKNFALTETIERSDFDMRQFKHGRISIYLCLPFEYLEMHRAWLRLVLTMAILAVLRVPRKPEYPALFLLDEFYAGIGRLNLIERAIPSIRGAGGRFSFIMQSLSQLKAMYPKVWEDFFSAAGAAIFCNVNDRETAEYVSARLGTTTMASGVGVPTSGVYMTPTARPLHTLDEVTRHPKNMEIVLLQNSKPMQCNRINCWEDNRFKPELDKSPMEY